jgi:hypothetical protein
MNLDLPRLPSGVSAGLPARPEGRDAPFEPSRSAPDGSHLPVSTQLLYPTSPQWFAKHARAFWRDDPRGFFVTPLTAWEYEKCSVLLTGGTLVTGAETGVAVDETGTIRTLWNRGLKGAGAQAVDAAIRRGARRVECFSPLKLGGLEAFYGRFGFRTIECHPFDPKLVDDPRQLALGDDWVYVTMELPR